MMLGDEIRLKVMLAQRQRLSSIINDNLTMKV